jgi:hypothetical protein
LSFTDTFILIEMRSGATTVFEREPLSWILFNRLVDLAELKDAHDHGNYLPSLVEAFAKLSSPRNSTDNCALCLIIFSDGRPSDFCLPRSTRQYLTKEIFVSALRFIVHLNCSLYKERLTFTAFGLGKAGDEFDTMKMIVEEARRSGAKSNFGYSYQGDEALRSILLTTSSLVSVTRSMMSSLNVGPTEPRVRKGMGQIQYKSDSDPDNWVLYNAKKYDFRYVMNETTGMTTLEENEVSMLPDAVHVAVCKWSIGEGSERLVSKMSEVDQMGRFIGPALAVKESLFELKMRDTRRWHRVFISTQMKAATLARKFNEVLDNMGVSPHIPRLKFLPCCVYECQTRSVDQIEKAFLAEAQLNPLNYKKWNDNSCGIDGGKKVLPDSLCPVKTLDAGFEPLPKSNYTMDVLEE